MSKSKIFFSFFVLSLFISSNILAVARSGGEPDKPSREKYRPKQGKEDIWYGIAKEPEVEFDDELPEDLFDTDKEMEAERAAAKLRARPTKRPTVLEIKPVKEKPFKFEFSGYVRLDAFTDSRQNVDYWKGIDYSYPKPPIFDPNGDDINQKAQFTMVPFGKVIAKVFGPELHGAKTSAVIKSDIPGKFRIENQSDTDIHDPFGMFRYQHGYLNLEWERTEVLAGVYYSPLVLLELCADTVSINAGEFFDPFNYSAMVRVRHKADPFEFVFAVHKLFWYDQWRDSLAPSLYAQANINIGEHLICAGVNMDVFTPRIETDPALAENLSTPALVTDPAATFTQILADTGSAIPSHGYREHESVKYFTAFIGTALKKNNVSWKHRLTYAECPFLYTLIGGFGPCSRNAKTNQEKYTTTRSFSYWTELAHMTKNREIGVFFGYTKNLGSRHKLLNSISTKELLGHLIERTDSGSPDLFAEGGSMNHAFRVQPRLRWFHGPMTIGIELEYTLAEYGTTNSCGRVDTITCEDRRKKVSNTRLLASVVYAF